MSKKDPNKKKRQKVYEELSREKFLEQRKQMYLPNMCYFGVTLILFLILLIMDGPSVIFDETSAMFSYLLIAVISVPLISLAVIQWATKTLHLLLTMSLHTLTIIPLLYGFWIKYDEMKNCSSYHMLVFYFMYFFVYVTMTTVFNKIRKRHLNSEESM